MPLYLPFCSETTRARSVLPRQDEIITAPDLITYLKALQFYSVVLFALLFGGVCRHLPIAKYCSVMDCFLFFFNTETVMGVGTALPLTLYINANRRANS